jgi:rare lipoprotein A
VKSIRSIAGCFVLIGGFFVLSGYDGVVRMADDIEKIFHTQIGDATYYAGSFHGKQTASGLELDIRKPVAAHRVYPFGTVARVTSLENGKSVTVVVVDRGPYGKNYREGAIIDLSRSAAERLGMIREGQVRVRVEVLIWGDGDLRDLRP